MKNHLRLHGTWRDSPEEVVQKAGLSGAEVVEYKLVEVRRTPVEQFLEEG